MRLSAIALSLALTVGCIGPKPQKGGTISHRSAIGSFSQANQPENPKESTTQKTESRSEKETIIQPGGTLEVSKFQPGETNIVVNVFRVPKDSAPVVIREKLEDKSETNVGGSFADTARELGARLSAMRPVQWAGILCVVVAAVMLWQRWWTPAVISGVTGVAMIIIAAVIPGNELIILWGGITVVVVGSLLVVYAYKSGSLDKDKDGRLDFLQGDKK